MKRLRSTTITAALSFFFLSYFVIACSDESGMEGSNILDKVLNQEQPPSEEETTNTKDYSEINSFLQQLLDADWEEIVTKIEYPLNRPYPNKKIKNEGDALVAFPKIVDENFRKLIQKYLDAPDPIDNTNSSGQIGACNGFLWFDSNTGHLKSIYYTSPSEMEKTAAINDALARNSHPILKEFVTVHYVGKTADYLFRIDITEGGYRYSQWEGDQNLGDEPDFLLKDGRLGNAGSGGTNTLIFGESGNATIIHFEQRSLCATEEGCGDFLIFEDAESGEITYEQEVNMEEDPLSLF